MIILQDIHKSFPLEGRELQILKGISFAIDSGEFVAVRGPSGSGKSTLLGIMAGLDRPGTGSVTIDGQDLQTLDEEGLARFRGDNIGFIFQNYQLLPTLTAIENVQIPMELKNKRKSYRREAEELLEQVGLGQRMHHYPSQLSGGEMQRVAIARALISEPKVIFADEPTGNLDTTNGANIMRLLTNLPTRATLVLVTHNPEIAALADRQIELRDGKVVGDHKQKRISIQTAMARSNGHHVDPSLWDKIKEAVGFAR